MTMTKTATGFIAQENLMSYATPQITQLTKGVDSWQAATTLAGLDWEPEVRAQQDPPPGILVPGVHGIWHDTTYLGIATDRYKLVSHAGMGEVVEAVARVHRRPITALVVLDGGRRVGARVTHDTVQVKGDPSPIELETWVWLRHDARGALAVLENAQRMFCTNQLGSLANRQTPLRVRHTGNVEEKVERLSRLLRERKDDWALWETEMGRLRATKVRDDHFDTFTRLYVPEPIPPVSNVRALNTQARLNALWRHYREEIGPNAYAGFQTIAEFEDKRRAARGPVNRFQRAIQPNPNKDRGLRMLVQVARG
jgi:hypothetical protein